MTTKYPVVFETEENGAVSAYVPGLPLYAAADTADEAEEAVLSGYYTLGTYDWRSRSGCRRPRA
jgi:hypothetical protein